MIAFHRNAARIVDKKGYLTVMMVTEKPSIAWMIASALSQKATEKKGVHKPCPIITFDGEFKGYPAYFKVTSVAGHMYSRDFSKEVNKRRKMDPIELYDVETF